MNLSISRRKQANSGFALMMVLGFMAVSFLIISGVLYSTSNTALQTDRHQRYYATQEAATAAAELVVARMVAKLQAGVAISVPSDLDPLDLKSDMEARDGWADFEFAFLVQGPDQLPSRPGLIWKYGALPVENDVYVIRAGARTLDLDTPIASVVEQEIQVAEIPLFAYMGYSEFDLSFAKLPQNDITLTGPFHSNRKVYCDSGGFLQFTDNVTSADEILATQHPSFLTIQQPGTLSFQQEADSQANSLRLAPGLGDLYQLLPQMANLADLFVVVDNGIIEVRDSLGTPFGPEVWTNSVTSTNFWDGREAREVRSVDINVTGLLGPVGLSGGGLLYLADLTQYGTETLAGFRLVNAGALPNEGLSVVTTNALYVKGNYNLGRAPAMLAADAVTLMSAFWNDFNSYSGMTSATSTTLNAAILTGTVPSDEVRFDGGYFNAVRLIEDWTGQTMTFNGAIATPFISKHANEPWRDASPFFYAPPTTRVFNHESSFTNSSGLPKGTPMLMLHTLIRGELVTTLPPSTLF